MIIKNKKTGKTYTVTQSDWEANKDGIWANLFTIEKKTTPPPTKIVEFEEPLPPVPIDTDAEEAAPKPKPKKAKDE